MRYIATVESIAGTPFQFLWHELPLDERITAAARAGFHGVDFWDWIDKDMDHLATVARDNGIVINMVSPWRGASLSDAADHRTILEQLDESLEMAARCGVQAFFLYTDEIGPGGKVVSASRPQSEAERWAEVEEGLRKVAERTEDSGVNVDLLVEPISKVHVQGYLLRSIGDADALVQRVGSSRLKPIFDLFHEQMNEGNLINNVRAVIDRLGAIHIADAPTRGVPGSGEINIANVYREILALGFDGTLGFEFLPGNRPTEEALVEIRSIFPITPTAASGAS